MSAAGENERAAELLQRLLTDPQLRADFRRRPATTCRAFELDDLADELETGTRGTATLEQRESRSGMAGVMVAAAVEGVALGELLARHAVEGVVDAADAAARLIDHVIGASGADPPIAAGAPPAAVNAAPTAAAGGPVPGRAAAPAGTVLASSVSPVDAAALPAAAPAPPAAYSGAEPSALPPAGAGAAVAPVGAPVAAGTPSALPPTAAAAPELPAEPAASALPAPAAAPALPAQPAASAQVVAASAPAAAPPASSQGSAAVAASYAPDQGAGLPPATAGSAPADPQAASATATEPGGIVATRNHARQISPESLEMGDKATAGGYPGDQASKTRIAGWMARRAAAAGVPPELPVMASLVESGLANLNHGDRDSVGFFQMRVGIWNSGPYRGYPNDAELQLKWFLDQATALKAARVAAGDGGFGSDPSTWGNWIADVERPDQRYRFRYQEQLDAARALVRSRGDGPALVSQAGSGTPTASPVSAAALAANAREIDPAGTGGSASSWGEQAVKLAKQYLGRPYVWGGETPASGFDCSGLVQYVYKQLGVELPRVTDEQFNVGKVVGRGDLQTGDIVFFRDASGYIHHEGLYLDGGRFLHAPHTGDVIKVSSLDEPYYAQQFAGGRRVGESAAIVHELEVTRRDAGQVAATRVHDARVMPVIDPSAPRPAG